MAIEIDARGLPCPQPVTKIKDALEKVKGDTLTGLNNYSTAESRDNVVSIPSYSGAEIGKDR